MTSYRIRRAWAIAAMVALSMVATEAVIPSLASSSTKKVTTTKPKPKPKKAATTTTRPKPTVASTTKVVPTSTSVITAKDQVLKGYEAYLTAFVAGAREPERAGELLPQGMTGDALTRMLEIRKLDAQEGLFWDGTRKDIVSGPRVETVSETTAVLRDCRSVGGVLRKKSTNTVVEGTTEPDVDDFRVTLVLVKGKWLVTTTERFNDVEGRSRCVPGSSSS